MWLYNTQKFYDTVINNLKDALSKMENAQMKGWKKKSSKKKKTTGYAFESTWNGIQKKSVVYIFLLQETRLVAGSK